MKSFPMTLALTSIAAALVSSAAMADHNSPHGSGWANMPNDIHNIRIEDDLSATEFRDIVKNGGANDTVNRYDTDTTSRRPDRSSVERSGGGRGRR